MSGGRLDATSSCPTTRASGPRCRSTIPGYRSTRLARADAAARHAARGAARRSTGPCSATDALGELDPDLTRQHDGEPLGERIIVTGRVLDEDGRPIRDTLVEVWQANAAGRYQPRGRPASGAARPELLRRRPLPHRRRRPLPLRHDQARLVPVGEPRERVAAGAHPLLALRPRVHAAARDADVLPRRPAVRVRPDLQLGARPEVARAARSRASTSTTTQPRVGARATSGTSCSAAAARHDADRGAVVTLPRTPSQTVGPFYAIGLCRRDRERARRRRTTGRDPADRARCSTAPATPIGDGMVEVWDAGRQALGPLRHRRRRRASRSSSRSRPRGRQAPHLDVLVFARGLLRHQLTRIYFPDEAEANAADPVLSGARRGRPRDARRRCRRMAALRFDIRMQGDRATVFFAH